MFIRAKDLVEAKPFESSSPETSDPDTDPLGEALPPPPSKKAQDERTRRRRLTGRLRALDYIYSEKNLYAINNVSGIGTAC
jgi:hypothetical protein